MLKNCWSTSRQEKLDRDKEIKKKGNGAKKNHVKFTNLMSFSFFADLFMKVSHKIPKAYSTCYFKVLDVHAVN